MTSQVAEHALQCPDLYSTLIVNFALTSQVVEHVVQGHKLYSTVIVNLALTSQVAEHAVQDPDPDAVLVDLCQPLLCPPPRPIRTLRGRS